MLSVCWPLAIAHLGDDVFHACCPAASTRRVSRRLVSRCWATSLRQALVGHHHEIVAGIGHAGQAEHLHRDRRAGGFGLLAVLVEQGANAAVLHAADQVIALLQRALLHQHGRDRATALVERGFDHHAGGAGIDHGARSSITSACSRIASSRSSTPMPVLADTGTNWTSPPHSSGTTSMLHQALLDVVADWRRACPSCSWRSISGTLAARAWLTASIGLRHHAVVGRDHQHHDVGQLGAARAHRGERRMARGVEEGDDALRRSSRGTRRCAG